MRKATSGVPGRFQAAVEILVEMVDTQTKANIKNANSRKFIAPMALDRVRLDFHDERHGHAARGSLPAIWTKIYAAMGHDPHHAYLRVVPTADLSTTLGLAVSILLLSLYYSVKIKGAGGWGTSW